MYDVVLESEIDLDGWREAARRLRMAGAAPAEVSWRVGEGARPLFAQEAPGPQAGPFSVPRAFIDLAKPVLLHRSERRFNLLYRLLWRLKDQPRLIEIASDPDVVEARGMEKSVRQAIHKMHAFVRFRPVENESVETYVAWFEPPHRVTEAAAEWFVRRMANLRFSILTPDVGVHWDGKALATSPGSDKAGIPADDGLEAHWRTYYASIFNPARLNPKVMTQHMARQYWKNLPEAELIPDLVAGAQGRTQAMVAAEPSQPSLRAARIAARRSRDEPFDTGIAATSLAEVAAGVGHCRRCPLWRDATQGVPGEGPGRAAMMLVGEQPGDQEDLAGHPFVGPAGTLLDKALVLAGIAREEVYVTNAVKHFKHEQRGKRRLHKTPQAGEVQACRWWLDNERRLVRPKVIVALGSTAAQAVLNRPVSVLKDRGAAGAAGHGATAFVTVHPSYLLRLPDSADKAGAWRAFVADLAAARALAYAA
jgi:DNA polymerase